MSEKAEKGTETGTEKSDVEKRVEQFVKEYGELRKRTQVDIAAYPSFVPNERGTFEIHVSMQPVDVSEQPQQSPFVPKKK